MARTVTAHLFHSVNGVVDDPHLWQFDAFGAEEGQFMSESLAPVTDAVIGRRLWQEWSEYWPTADDPFGQWVNPVRKHVLSSTLPAELTWNSTLVTGDPQSYLRDLKEHGDGAISVLGGVATVRSLFLSGMIDELTLTTHPAVTNQGRRLFDDSVPTTRLQLLRTTQTSAGNVVMTYGLRG